MTYLCPKKTPMVSSDFMQVGFVILVEKQKVTHVWLYLRKWPLLLAFETISLKLISHLSVTNKICCSICFFSSNSVIKVCYIRTVVLSWWSFQGFCSRYQYFDTIPEQYILLYFFYILHKYHCSKRIFIIYLNWNNRVIFDTLQKIVQKWVHMFLK